MAPCTVTLHNLDVHDYSWHMHTIVALHYVGVYDYSWQMYTMSSRMILSCWVRPPLKTNYKKVFPIQSILLGLQVYRYILILAGSLHFIIVIN